MNNRIILIISFICLFLVGCGAGATSNAVRDYRLSVGTATMDDFTTLSERILIPASNNVFSCLINPGQTYIGNPLFNINNL